MGSKCSFQKEGSLGCIMTFGRNTHPRQHHFSTHCQLTGEVILTAQVAIKPWGPSPAEKLMRSQGSDLLGPASWSLTLVGPLAGSGLRGPPGALLSPLQPRWQGHPDTDSTVPLTSRHCCISCAWKGRKLNSPVF